MFAADRGRKSGLSRGYTESDRPTRLFLGDSGGASIGLHWQVRPGHYLNLVVHERAAGPAELHNRFGPGPFTRVLSNGFWRRVVHERDPVVLKLSNAWITLNSGGPLTDDKPTVTPTPKDPHTTSAFLNVRVADIGCFGGHDPRLQRTDLLSLLAASGR